MNEETQRLLPAALLTLALHSAFFSWQMENRPIELPKPEKISVTLKKTPPPPPPQQKIVKELLPPPELKPIERQPLETLPPQSKVVKRLKPPPEIKKVRHKPLEQLPPPAVAPAALRPMETLPPAQGRISRQLPRLPDNFAVSQPALRPLETLPEPAVWEEPAPVIAQEEIFEEEVVETEPVEEIVETEPVQEEIVEEYTPPPVEQFVEEQVWEEPPRRVQPQPSRQRQTESDYASSGAGNQEAAPLYASNPPPEYPMQARRRGLQGVVTIEALIDTGGNVSDLRLFSSSGHSILDKAALSSVRGWQFQPGTVGGRRKAMWVKVPVRFELN